VIVEQHDTTVVVRPGQAFVVKDAGNLIIHTQGDTGGREDAPTVVALHRVS